MIYRAILIAALAAVATPPGAVCAAPAKKPVASVKKVTAKKAVAKPTPAMRLATAQALYRKQNETVTDCDAMGRNVLDLQSVDDMEIEISDAAGQDFATIDLFKDEYETTTQYKARFDATLRKYFGDPSKAVFVVHVPYEYMTYDADDNDLKIRPFPYGSDGVTRLTVKTIEQKMSTRRGETAMGVKFTYENWLDYTRTLEIHGKQPEDQNAQIVHIDVKPDMAPFTKSGMLYLVFGAMAEPYHLSADTEDAATLSNPYYTLIRKDTYMMSAKCVLLYDYYAKRVVATYGMEQAGLR